MLVIQVKECCRECKHAEIDQTTYEARPRYRNGPVRCVRVSCRHAPVCKTYLESDTPWQEKNQM